MDVLSEAMDSNPNCTVETLQEAVEQQAKVYCQPEVLRHWFQQAQKRRGNAQAIVEANDHTEAKDTVVMAEREHKCLCPQVVHGRAEESTYHTTWESVSLLVHSAELGLLP